MKTKCNICNSLAVLLLSSYTVCFAASEQPQSEGLLTEDDAIGIVLDVLRSDDQEMQAVAIAMVKEMPGTEVTKVLARELPNLSVTSQVQLLSALGDRGDRAASPAVIAAANAADMSVRIAALRALGQLGNASTVGLLAQTAAATGGDEQKAARESLYRLRGPTVDGAVLAGIPKADPKAKVELISSVGQRNISAAVSTLLKTAKDSDRKVRAESFKVLKVVAGPQHLPALVDLLINVRSSSDRNEAQKTITAVAHKIEDKNRQAEAVLVVLPSIKDIERRSSLLSVLGKIGDSSALPCLREALDSNNAEIQGAAIRALADWPTCEPASDLLKVAQSSDNRVHRILALRGAVRLLGLDGIRPVKETIEMYSTAMNLAPDAGEKKRVLSGLANTKSLDALLMAADYLQDKTLFREAEFAVVKIAQGIYTSFPQPTEGGIKPVQGFALAKVVMTKIIQTSKNDSLRQQAREVIDRIDRLKIQTQD
ncbi:MAG: HEAT repeat domain-containing protein [Planctomycetota bacterium]|jgi:HEAT repeat protein